MIPYGMWRFVVLRWASYEELYHHFYYSSDQLRYVRMKEKPHHYHVLSAIAVLYSVLYSVQLDNTLPDSQSARHLDKNVLNMCCFNQIMLLH